jgi:hypothetical protein
MATRKASASAEPSKVSTHDLNGIEGWDELEKSEQDIIRSETVSLDKALIDVGRARLAVGEHLFNVQEILKPKRMFNRYLTALNWTSRSSAYRAIDLYSAAKNILPAPVMEQAMLRATDHLNLRRLEENPPPRTTNVVAINEYLDTVTASTPQEPSTDVNVLKKEVFNIFDNRFQRLPAAGRSRTAFALSIAGMILYRAGLTGPQTVTPVPIPAAFKGVMGRPRRTA